MFYLQSGRMEWRSGSGPAVLMHSKRQAHLCTRKSVSCKNENKSFQLGGEASFVLATAPSIAKGSGVLRDGLPHHMNCTGIPHVDSLHPVIKADFLSNTGA